MQPCPRKGRTWLIKLSLSPRKITGGNRAKIIFVAPGRYLPFPGPSLQCLVETEHVWIPGCLNAIHNFGPLYVAIGDAPHGMAWELPILPVDSVEQTEGKLGAVRGVYIHTHTHLIFHTIIVFQYHSQLRLQLKITYLQMFMLSIYIHSYSVGMFIPRPILLFSKYWTGIYSLEFFPSSE